MKTSIVLLCAVLAPSGLVFGEAVYDELVERQLIKANENLVNVDTKLGLIQPDIAAMRAIAEQDNSSIDAIKDAVQDTVERMDSLLERIGDPNAVSMSRAGDLAGKVENAKTGGLQERPPVEEPGSDFFNETGDGIIEKLGTTFKYTPPGGGDERDEDRVPSRYIGESEQLKAINEYYRVRDAAVTRRSELLDILKDVLEEMESDSKDFAHLAKQTALVEIIQGQLKVCGDDINNAYNDVAVKGLQVYTLNSMRSKGDSEFTELENEERQEALDGVLDEIRGGGSLIPGGDSSGTDGATTGITGGFLPWTTYR
ncbi:hypothetical protein [Roseimicrobium sp. ORNL1]|uniref:hypothetical protein n=1 Tax=Roseimicrobium sp. ORNL1 TaxID=2711231 RepID=UPI0013E1DC9D|nr:hypothetical protein [Roseimicrobium sp. ORNL1]QIF03868.1 hypothetical protein G5S37_20845 [Roseimicrobium sp. ORNL1]